MGTGLVRRLPRQRILGDWRLNGKGAEPAKTIVEVALAIVAVSLVVWFVMGLLSEKRAEQFALRLGGLPKVGGSAAEMWQAVWLYRSRPFSVWLTIGISWVCFVGYVFAFYFAASAFHDDKTPLPSLSQHFLIVPLGMVISTLPGFPGGLGISQGGFGGLYLLFSFSWDSGVLASVIYYLMQATASLLGVVVSSLLGRAALPTAESQVAIQEAPPDPNSAAA